MERMATSLTKMALLSVTLGSTAVVAYGQSDISKSVQQKAVAAVSKLQSSCDQDIKRYCSTVTPEEGRLLVCMEAHDDKLSPQCLYELHEAAQKVHIVADQVKEASFLCRDEIAKFCATVQPGQGRVVNCLLSNKVKMSKGCAEAVENLQTAAER